jgi:hypothetical protein
MAIPSRQDFMLLILKIAGYGKEAYYLNRESLRATTRARYSIGEIQFPVEGLDSL